MIPRLIEIKDLDSAQAEMRAIGVDGPGIELMAPKAVFRIVKIKGVQPVAANIIKQEILALGGEAATTRGAINHSVKASDVLLFGTLKQLYKLARKLKASYFGLPAIAQQIEDAIANHERRSSKFKIGRRTLEIGLRTYIMGILNVTPDSFSDGNEYFKPENALERAERLIDEGADMIDIGGESTRPGAKTVTAGEEIKRIIPVIKQLARKKRAIISVDTRKAIVAAAAIKAGAQMVNDVSGLRFDNKMAKVIADHGVAVCIMHSRGNPANMQKNPLYSDLLGEVIDFLAGGLAIARKADILHGKILVDPGIGFGKTVEHNLEILRRLNELKVLGCPILVGPSRKSFIGKVLDLPVGERVEGTAAAVALAIANGADMVRVHDVKEIKRVVQLTDAIVRTREK